MMVLKRNLLAVHVLMLSLGYCSSSLAAAPTCTEVNGQKNCTLADWTTQANSNDVGQTSNFNGAVSVTNGDIVNLTGPANVAPGSNGTTTNITLGSLGLDSSYFEKTKLALGTAKDIIVSDPVNGTKHVTVYDSDNFALNQALNPNSTISLQNPIDTDAGRGMYVNTVYATVDSSQGGGTLNVLNLPAQNEIGVIKQTAGLFQVKGSNDDGAATATLNWGANRAFRFDYPTVVSGNGGDQKQSFDYTQFKGSEVSVDGKSYTVTDLASFQAYNNALVDSIKNGGEINASNYNDYLKLAYNTESQSYSVPGSNNVPQGDSATLAMGSPAVIYATGKSASVNIEKGANLSLFVPTWWANLIQATSGATVTNNGTLGALLTNAVGATGANFYNTKSGVVFSGVVDYGNNKQDLWSGGANGIYLNGLSKGFNFGVINAVGSQNGGGVVGVVVNNSTFINESGGVINVGGTTFGNGWIGSLSGIKIDGNNSVVTNNGDIKIGYGSQYSLDNASTEVANTKTGGATGILVQSNNSILTNKASIIMGSYIDNAYGIQLIGGTNNRQVINDSTGVITINSGLRADNKNYNPKVTYGIYAHSNGTQSSTNYVDNKGTINVAGVYGVGMYAYAWTQAANVQSSGTINVTGDASYDTYGNMQNRNYAMQVDINPEATVRNAIGTISGLINVVGNGAVGAYVKNGGILNITNTAELNLNTGSNQIGVVLSDANSKVNSALKTFTVGTKDSTGFYIMNGASFVGEDTDGNPLTFDLTGQNAKGIIAAGSGTNISTQQTTYNVLADDAQAIQVRSSAAGTVSKDTVISLTGTGSVGASVDGMSYDLFDRRLDKSGNVVNDDASAYKDANTTLTSSATLHSNSIDAIGYKVVNSGTLKLTSDSVIDLTGSGNIGVLVDGTNLSDTDAPSTMYNDGSITTNSIGLQVSGGKTAVNNTGTVTATDGIAAILLEKGASLTLGSEGSTSASSTGNIIAQGSADGVLIYGDSANEKNNATLAKENSGLITVEGSGAGIRFTNSDGSARSDDFDISQSQGLTINVSGANGHGIVANTSGIVKTGANVNINNASGGSALEVTGGATTVNNSGNLISKSTTAPVVATSDTVNNFTNTGLIQAVDTEHDAVNLTVAGSTFTNDDQSAKGGSAGVVSGKVNIVGDNSQVNLNGASQSSDIIATGKNNSFTLNDVMASNTGIFSTITGGTTEENTLNLNNSAYVFNNPAAISNFNQLNLKNNSIFTLSQYITLGTANAIDIDQSSILAVDPTNQGDFDLANNLTGNGKVTVNNGGQFNLVGDSTSFTGDVVLGNAQFNLADKNTTNLTNANLVAGIGSSVTVGNGDQNIGGLTFDGGTVNFITAPGEAKADTFVNAGTLDISGNGQVGLTVNPFEEAMTPVVDGSLGLLEQDDQNVVTQLASGTSVVGAGGNLTLVDKDGNPITDAISTDIIQNNQKVAEGTYDYRLTGSNGTESGLYVNYGLTQLDLIGKGSNALVLAQKEGATGQSADLSAKLTGTGDLAINAGSGSVSLSNNANDYSGATTVNTGTLRADADNVLGNTTSLDLSDNTSFQLNGHTQTIKGNIIASTGSSIDLRPVTGTSSGTKGELTAEGTTVLTGAKLIVGANNTFNATDTLTTDQSSTVDLAGGTLNLNNGGTSQGSLTGAGALNVNNGVLNVTGANTGLSATTTISNATVNVDSINGLGTGAIDFKNGANSLLNVNSASGTLVNNLSGSGVANINNSSVVLAGNNSGFTADAQFNVDGTSQLTATEANNLGKANVDLSTNAGLNINTATDWELVNNVSGTGDLNKSGAGTTTITGNHVNLNSATVNEGGLLIKNGQLTATETTVAKGASLIGDSNSVLAGALNNDGNVYVGNASNLSSADTSTVFEITGSLTNTGNVYLSDLDTPSNFVGNTLKVDGDLKGDGNYYMQTQLASLKGDLINVAGAVTGNNSLFIKDSGTDATTGSEKLKVVQSGKVGAGSFALNGQTVDIGAYKYGLQKQGNDWYLLNTKDIDNGGNKGSSLSKGANAAVGMHGATASMWEQELGTLMSRMGDLRLDNNYNGGVWVRQLSHEIHASPSSSRAYQQQYNGTQVGADKAFLFDGGKFYLGVMTGISRSTLDFKESTSGSIESQTFGIYGTALFDNGYYLDTVTKYGHMKNKIDYYNNAGEKIKGHYRTNALGLSIEGGKRFTFENKWFIEPQLQFTASHLRGKSYTLNNGLAVKSDSMELFNGRAGIVAGTKMTFDRVIAEPYVEFSHTQEFSGTGRVTVNNSRLDSDQIGTRQHYGVGVNFNVAKQHNFFINASYEQGSKMEQPWGIKGGYQFRF